MADRLLRLDRVLEYVPFSASTIRRRMKEGTFPLPWTISDGIIAWSHNEIQQFIREQKAKERSLARQMPPMDYERRA